MENKRAILEYWTSLEFFSPYLLDSVLDSKKKYQKIYAEGPTEILPWALAPAIREHDPTTPLVKGYHLYLGLFKRAHCTFIFYDFRNGIYLLIAQGMAKGHAPLFSTPTSAQRA